MMSPEGREKQAIKKYLDSIGAWHFSPSMNGFGKAGVPDIIACIDGQFWGIEVKRPENNPTPLQERRMAEIRKQKGMTAWGTAPRVIEQLKNWYYS